MSLIETLDKDFKEAMLARNRELVDLLRLLKSALKNEMINLKKDSLTDDEALVIIKKEAKKRKDSIEQFTKGDRKDLADKEAAELELMAKYLPEELGEDEIRAAIQEVINSMGEVTPSQFGAIMGATMSKLKGAADGALVSKLVKEELNK